MNNEIIIESPANPKIKALVKLRERKSRDELALMIIDGVREIGLALKNNFKLLELYFCQELIEEKDDEILKLARQQDSALFKVSKRVFEKIAFGDRAEGFVAVARQSKKRIEDLSCNKDCVFVVLESIEKPGNLGAIIRTSEAVGVDAIIVCDGKTDIFNPNCIRASIGACFSLPIVETSVQAALEWFKEKRIKIISAVPAAKLEYWKADLGAPCAIVFGSEDKGVSKTLADSSELKVNIPMKGEVDSLNVSTSAAIILYELLRQRTTKES